MRKYIEYLESLECMLSNRTQLVERKSGLTPFFVQLLQLLYENIRFYLAIDSVNPTYPLSTVADEVLIHLFTVNSAHST
jgi:hypothetical protein